MRGLLHFSDLLGTEESRIDWKRAFESIALDELHHQRAILNAVNVSDVGMIERRQHFGLALEAC